MIGPHRRARTKTALTGKEPGNFVDLIIAFIEFIGFDVLGEIEERGSDNGDAHAQGAKRGEEEK